MKKSFLAMVAISIIMFFSLTEAFAFTIEEDNPDLMQQSVSPNPAPAAADQGYSYPMTSATSAPDFDQRFDKVDRSMRILIKTMGEDYKKSVEDYKRLSEGYRDNYRASIDTTNKFADRLNTLVGTMTTFTTKMNEGFNDINSNMLLLGIIVVVGFVVVIVMLRRIGNGCNTDRSKVRHTTTDRAPLTTATGQPVSSVTEEKLKEIIDEAKNEIINDIRKVPDEAAKKFKEFDSRPLEFNAADHHVVYNAATDEGCYLTLYIEDDHKSDNPAEFDRKPECNRGNATHLSKGAMVKYFRDEDFRKGPNGKLINYLNGQGIITWTKKN